MEVLLQINGTHITNLNKSFNPLFIGFGKQALEYAKVLKSLDIKISSVCVTNIKKNKKNLIKYQVTNVYNDIKKAINAKKYNCIFVFLPWNLIEKKIPYIIRNTKKKIYCEKPIALSLKSLSKINKLSQMYNKELYVLYNRRYYNIYSTLKKKLKKNYSVEVNIPEKIDLTLKKIDKRLKGKIKYHLTSHWMDFFISLTNKKIMNIKKVKNSYIFFLNGTKNRIVITPNIQGSIEATFKSGNLIYKLETLEKMEIFNVKQKKVIKRFNEFKNNKFKPGVLNLLKSILLNKKNILPKTNELLKLYKSLSFLPF